MAFKLKNSEHFNSAQSVFGSAGTTYNGNQYQYMNIPKAKFSFVVHFELSVTAKKFITEVIGSDVQLGKLTSFLIKDVNLPGFCIDTAEMNQYNRTRLHQGRIHYDAVSMNIYDTVSSSALMLLDIYRQYFYGDFSDKNLNSWRYDIVSTSQNHEAQNSILNTFKALATAFDTADYTWGRSLFNQGDQNEGYFFKRIDIYEIDGNTYTVHNIHNPVIESVKLDQKTHEGGDASLVNISFKHEGISNICPYTGKRAIAAPTAQIAKLLSATGHGEFSAMNFFKYWGEMDDAPINAYDPNQVAGYPSQSGGIDLSSATGIVNTVLGIKDSAVGIIEAIEGGGSFTDILENTKNAIGEGNIFSEGLGDLSGGIESISHIGGLF